MKLEPTIDTDKGKILFRGDYDYSKLDGESITLLKEMLRSPKHYMHRKRFQRHETKSLAIGTTSHTAVLEPERFIKDYAIWKSEDKDGKKQIRSGKKWEEFQQKNEGLHIIKDDEYKEAVSLRDAVRRDPIAMKYLAMGEPEVALQWTDEDTGLLCRGRCDWLTKIDGEYVVVDLKTTRNADPEMFSKDCAKIGYHLQAAYYTDGIEAATGEVPRFVIIAVESSQPYDVVTYIVPQDVLEVGRVVYKELLEKLKKCQASNEWPGQGDMMERYLTLPKWCMPEEESDSLEGLDWSEAA